MGALVGKAQVQDVLDQVARLEQEAEWLFGQDKQAHVLADNPEHGAFLPACTAIMPPVDSSDMRTMASCSAVGST